MDWLHLLALLGILIPMYYINRLESARLADPRYVRACGLAVPREALTIAEGAEIVGYYDGCEIRAAVEYLGIRYRFESVVPPSSRRRPGPGELYVLPGLLYVAE